MEDFASLVCPSYGGKLKAAINATSLTCQHCGNEHIVRHDPNGAVMLEAYARCQVCGRNDRVEKVSAVLSSQALEQQTTGSSTLPVRDNSAWQAVMKFVKTRQALEVTGQPARWKREELYAERENRSVREVKDAPDTD